MPLTHPPDRVEGTGDAAPVGPPKRVRAARAGVFLAGLLLAMALAAHAALVIPDLPLLGGTPGKPMVMLVASKDHRIFTEAYNDASDIDGDGILDIRFKPSITYLGLFNPGLCYAHNGYATNEGLFTPTTVASGDVRTCSNAWSGNWLNYVTTSRIDGIRVVLYGGMREVDTPEQTILRRAYIPQDGHSWAKEYTSLTHDGYRISDYTPLAAPTDGRRHFFGNLTPVGETDCSRLSNCSDKPPWLSVVTNSPRRVWDWASTERVVLKGQAEGDARTDLAVRVQACPPGFTQGCRAYGAPEAPLYKPAGLLQEFGETDQILFGLITGSYDFSMAGGRLRKVVSSFRDEVDLLSGQFKPVMGIVHSFNALRILDFNNGDTKAAYKGVGLVSGEVDPNDGSYPDWGNPIGEMMVEALRYFQGTRQPTFSYGEFGTNFDSKFKARDAAMGLPIATWDDPYANASLGEGAACARANLIVISDPHLSYDSDQVPGAYPAFANRDYFARLGTFKATAEADAISEGEAGVKGQRFIGESANSYDAAPTPKKVKSLAEIRGLAPEEPTKQGSFTAAAAAYWGRRTDLRSAIPGNQYVETFVLAQPFSLPRFKIPAGNGSVTLIPFAKSTWGSIGHGAINSAMGKFQPTSQIVDFYVEKLANSGPGDRDPSINGGRYSATFRVSFEDVEQGSDFEMDAIARYQVDVTPSSGVTVTVMPTASAGSIMLNIGYVISGTTEDGVYLEVQSRPERNTYFLNTPRGQKPGYCAVPLASAPGKGNGTGKGGGNGLGNSPPSYPPECEQLPYFGAPAGDPGSVAMRNFTAGSTPSAGWLADPLWYAAKWGGFTDRDGDLKPHLQTEWDADGDGVPDNYLYLQSPQKMLEALRRTLQHITARAASGSSIATNSTSLNADSRLYQAQFNPQYWSGDLIAWKFKDEAIDPEPAWSATEAMPAWDQRQIFLLDSDHTVKRMESWGALSSATRQLLVDQSTVDYLRGRRAGEVRRGGQLRDRAGPIGDIVNSSPFFDRLSQALYVGANDGMLHAFDADQGKELFAFIPGEALTGLAAISKPGYRHKFLVDGEMALSPRMRTTGGRAFLYTLLGRGGRGLFSLDVTNPHQFSDRHFLWEYAPRVNREAAADPDLGYMLSRPVVANLANGMLGVLVGNGYNSPDGKSVLYVFIIGADGSLKEVRKLTAGVGPDNGLAGPAVFDTDGDGVIDVAYAGDLKGQVWKFEMGSPDPAQWRVAFDGNPLYTTRDPAHQVQPITAPLMVARNTLTTDPNFNKLFVFFGTGAYFRQADLASTQTQSWWGLIDDGRSVVPAGRGSLMARTITDTAAIADSPVRAFSTATAGDMAGKRGWVIDLGTPSPGERIITATRFMALAVPTLVVSSLVPSAADICSGSGKGYVNLVQPFSGASVEVGLIDADRDGKPENDRLNGKFVGSIDLRVGLPTEVAPISLPGDRTLIAVGGSGEANSGALLRGVQARGASSFVRRLSWREIFTD